MRIRAVVLLAGGTPGSLAAQLGRSVLDLPNDGSTRLLDLWVQRVSQFLSDFGPDAGDPEVRLLCGEFDRMPSAAIAGPLRVHAERDGGMYRGTAGVLRDLCQRFDDGEYVIVGTASQCPGERLLQELVAAADLESGVTVGAGPEGVPNGLMVVRCEALRQIPVVGYVDLKEQALPRIAESFGVRVVMSPRGGATPIRDLHQYIDALRSWHCFGNLDGVRSGRPFEERWKPAFAMIEQGARVAASARLRDSVVLAGGVVEAGSELVRSVVGPRGVVRRARLVVDQLVTGPADRPVRRRSPWRSAS